MNNYENILFVFILAFGLYLFFKARRYGRSQKNHFETEAFKRLDRNLAKLDGGQQAYKIYTRENASDSAWRQVDLAVMRQDILNDCTRSLPDGDMYRKARFTLRHKPESRSLFYIIGVNKYDFSKVQDN